MLENQVPTKKEHTMIKLTSNTKIASTPPGESLANNKAIKHRKEERLTTIKTKIMDMVLQFRIQPNFTQKITGSTMIQR
jgi:hypothetical protein